jgi:hypothetical protein
MSSSPSGDRQLLLHFHDSLLLLTVSSPSYSRITGE